MNKIKYLAIGLVVALMASCSVDYLEDPNQAKVVPTSGLMNRVQKRLMDDTRDEWFSGRQSILWVQYWNQVNYTEEDRYQYRETTNQNGWDDLYKNAQDMQDIITLNTDEATAPSMIQYGPNENQIAAARIMMVYIYHLATEMWGDVPYWSYGNDDADFQANSLKDDGITTPKYATQAKIYADMLKELTEASAQVDVTEKMIDGDNFFGGDASQWVKFANSLRLRLANRVKDKLPEAASYVTSVDATTLMTSNADNAGVTYENNALNGAPMYRAYVVNAREDFAPSVSFVELLQGKRGNFGADPRLDIFVADNGDGYKVGIPLTGSNAEVNAFKHASLPGDAILAPDYTEYYMEYAEVCFIMAENSLSQEWYEKGVVASLTRWGIDDATATAYAASLPAVTLENILTQKYIALYMQPNEAWSEYRRTGFPKTLVKPNVAYDYTYSYVDGAGAVVTTTENYTFVPIGGLTDLPNRNMYLLNEASVNNANVTEATTNMGGDKQDTKMWWQK